MTSFPLPLNSYNDAALSLTEQLMGRIHADPFNLIAALIFFTAVIHTFCAGMIMRWSHRVQTKHHAKVVARGGSKKDDVSALARLLHYLGEVECIFGIWALILAVTIAYFFGWSTMTHYVSGTVNYTEPMFVVVVMAAASTRPILYIAEKMLQQVAAMRGGTTAAWWWSILTIAPLLGSLITEPAAMTIAAMLLGKQFYSLRPSRAFEYATLGLLFVNVSIGGTLTHFAAPPVLMVASAWEWTTPFMLTHFGWKAVIAIALSNSLYYLIFKHEFKKLESTHVAQLDKEAAKETGAETVPPWIILVHVAFLAWIVINAHYPALFIGGFLFLIGFMHMTENFQSKLQLKGPMLVGFFLAGLVIHGGLQGWWISPVLSSLPDFPLYTAATLLTAFNDNAAITYLSTFVENFSDTAKYAVVAGAVAGGGLTVIANAPNPAGQAILARFFSNHEIKPHLLFLGALLPTLVVFACFWVL